MANFKLGKKFKLLIGLMIVLAVCAAFFVTPLTAFAEENVNFTALEAKLAEAEALDLKNYSTTSWSRVETAVINAKIAIELKDIQTQADVNSLTKALETAIDSLSVDESALRTLLTRVGYVITEQYDPLTIDDLNDAKAYVAAEFVSGLPQYRIDELYEILNDAYTSLARIIDCPDKVSFYLHDIFEITITPSGGEWEYDSDFWKIDEETGELIAIKSGTTEMTYTTLQGLTKTIEVEIKLPVDYTMTTIVIIVIIVTVILFATLIFIILRSRAKEWN